MDKDKIQEIRDYAEAAANLMPYEDDDVIFSGIEIEEIKREFEERIKNEISEIGQNHISDWENDDDDPDPDDFRNWVKDATGYRGPWRPFSREVRTRSLVEWLKGEFSEMINGFKDEIINW